MSIQSIRTIGAASRCLPTTLIIVLVTLAVYHSTAHAGGSLPPRLTKDQQQDIKINTNATHIFSHTRTLDSHAKALDSLSNSVGGLTDIQVRAELKAMLYESLRSRFEVSYSKGLHGAAGDEVGLVFTVNIGKPYAEKRAEQLEARIKDLEQKLAIKY